MLLPEENHQKDYTVHFWRSRAPILQSSLENSPYRAQLKCFLFSFREKKKKKAFELNCKYKKVKSAHLPKLSFVNW